MTVLKYFTIDDILKERLHSERIAIVRVDFNCPVNPRTRSILDDERIKLHTISTIKRLAGICKGVVVLAHQGRKGEETFIPLKEHAGICQKYLNGQQKVLYPWYNKSIDEIIKMGEAAVTGKEVQEMIANLDNGNVLLLENVRFCDYETVNNSNGCLSSPLISMLKQIQDPIVCFDGFSVSHRSHCSVVGLQYLSDKIYAGGVIEREIRQLSEAIENPKKPLVLVCGGAKVPESFTSIKRFLEQDKASYVLTSGLVGLMFLWAQDKNIGSPTIQLLEKKGLNTQIDTAKELLVKYTEQLRLPIDVAYSKGGGALGRREILVKDLKGTNLNDPIKDIGTHTQIEYAKIILDARTVVMNGSAGRYEEAQFTNGTSALIRAIGALTTYFNGFALIGGGDTTAAVRLEPAHIIEGISLSPSGKAFLQVVATGQIESLPGIKMLSSR